MAPLNDLEILITAQDGYPAFEKAVLSARTRIDMAFRVFDPRMKLLSPEAQAVGETWADLLAAKLDEGIRITIRISDFDPVARPEMHRASWKSHAVLSGIRELTKHPDLLVFSVDLHPARVGVGPRVALWPKAQGRLAQTCAALNDMPPAMRREALRTMPGVAALIGEKDGTLHPRRALMPPLVPATHHQKIAVVDDEIVYVGGLDLDERRSDTPDHRGPAEQTWHDVQLIFRDAALGQAARAHIDRFKSECAGEVAVTPPPGLIRTLSVRRVRNGASLSPRVADTGILDRHLALIAQAERLIYLESQFLRDPVLADALVARAAEAPDLGLICLLPAAPQEVAFDGEDTIDHRYGDHLQATCIIRLQKAFGDLLFIASPAQPFEAETRDRQEIAGAPMVFVHSKVSVFDDIAGLVTSANLNGRSMRWDTEIGVELTDPAQVAALRERTMGAWLPVDAPAEMTRADPGTVALWRGLAAENAVTSPRSRRGFLLPYPLHAARKFGMRLPGIPVEMV